MRNFIVIGLAVLVILITGYGGVMSIDKNLEDASYKYEPGIETQNTVGNESEHVECTLKDEEKVVDQLDSSSVSVKTGKTRLGGVTFTTSLDSALKEAGSVERVVLVYLHSRSCGWCKKFEEEVLSDPRIISSIESSFIPVAVDVNERKDLASEFKVYGTPTNVFLDFDGVETGRYRGYIDVDAFLKVLEEEKLS